MKRCGALFLLFLFVTLPAQAAYFTGAYLLQVCASDENGEELLPGGHIACQSYISGVIDYNNLVQTLGTGGPTVDFCLPETIELNQLQDIVFTYLLKHRKEHASFVASPAVALALYEVYPCKKK